MRILAFVRARGNRRVSITCISSTATSKLQLSRVHDLIRHSNTEASQYSLQRIPPSVSWTSSNVTGCPASYLSHCSNPFTVWITGTVLITHLTDRLARSLTIKLLSDRDRRIAKHLLYDLCYPPLGAHSYVITPTADLHEQIVDGVLQLLPNATHRIRLNRLLSLTSTTGRFVWIRGRRWELSRLVASNRVTSCFSNAMCGAHSAIQAFKESHSSCRESPNFTQVQG